MEFLAFLLYTTILEGSVFVYDKELLPVGNQTTIECNDSHQKLMNDDFHLCVTEYTQDYYAYRGSENPEEFHEQTCKLLANTVDDCGKIWELCYNPSEVRSIKDMHIQARIGQFQDNSDEIDVNKCLIVKEYQESGRADNMKQTIRGTCSIGEVSKVQRELQECSHNVSLKLFHQIQSLNEGNEGIVHTTRPVVPGLRSRSGIRGTVMDLTEAKKSQMCTALETIAKTCIKSINECFSEKDTVRINRQHIQQLQDYYGKMYLEDKEILSNCPQLKFLNEENDSREIRSALNKRDPEFRLFMDNFNFNFDLYEPNQQN